MGRDQEELNWSKVFKTPWGLRTSLVEKVQSQGFCLATTFLLLLPGVIICEHWKGTDLILHIYLRYRCKLTFIQWFISQMSIIARHWLGQIQKPEMQPMLPIWMGDRNSVIQCVSAAFQSLPQLGDGVKSLRWGCTQPSQHEKEVSLSVDYSQGRDLRS